MFCKRVGANRTKLLAHKSDLNGKYLAATAINIDKNHSHNNHSWFAMSPNMTKMLFREMIFSMQHYLSGTHKASKCQRNRHS